MANQDHLKQFKKGVSAWNRWRDAHPAVRPDLSGVQFDGASLKGVNLSACDLRWASLRRADLEGASLDAANLFEARLTNARLSKASFVGTNLVCVDLRGSRLIRANLSRAHVFKSDLSRANLTNAILELAVVTDTSLVGATLKGARIYGTSAWDIDLTAARQSGLVIGRPAHTPQWKTTITVDDLEVAQFVWLLLHNQRIRKVISTIGQKAVLILGRFTPERKAVLDALRTALRERGYVPIIFDFERPSDRDFTETIMTLAGMCRFIVADITNPRSSPLELSVTVPNYMVPFVPIIQQGEEPFSMFSDLQGKHDWVLDLLEYDTAASLVRKLGPAVIEPALKKYDELLARKTRAFRKRRLRDYPEG